MSIISSTLYTPRAGVPASQIVDKKISESLVEEVKGEDMGDLGQMTRDHRNGKVVPVPFEFVEEIQGIAKSMDMSLDRIRLIISNNKDQPASAGCRAIPTMNGYLIVPSAMVYNCMLDRSRNLYLTTTPQIEEFPRSQTKLVMADSAKFVIAHEISHLQSEDFLVRWSAQFLAVASIFAVPQYCYRQKIPIKFGVWLATVGIVPLFFGLKALTRIQETNADVQAAKAGYVDGGIAFWRDRLEFEASVRPGSTIQQQSTMRWWKDHPPHHERLARMLYERGRIREHRTRSEQ
ncbi:hypothetical protein SARC_06822 [Sphaeroforma arctica JP610]|uniref:Peptidase M48 domain-containing protein n=1 Tax=Sphaeroforma arctica JP610 TaxID=667725 RepID=A0A0L0FW90_9EUKA|nr:hypothetical protein SARC_06822 [Sphaeroforma arctica JP610]KNC80841.1 hypothetical protein SARC_06822 [Sphaeroforma arctica JP610]|eukprot:XP_014154743.1 hypothetical protein SARC_06822 [Sphaeroforma arctica JP610]